MNVQRGPDIKLPWNLVGRKYVNKNWKGGGKQPVKPTASGSRVEVLKEIGSETENLVPNLVSCSRRK